eukprot:11219439-Lingulodinium_polyedra.AAC.1
MDIINVAAQPGHGRLPVGEVEGLMQVASRNVVRRATARNNAAARHHHLLSMLVGRDDPGAPMHRQVQHQQPGREPQLVESQHNLSRIQGVIELLH